MVSSFGRERCALSWCRFIVSRPALRVETLDDGTLTPQGHGLAHRLAFQHVSDVHLLNEEELLHHDEAFLDHRDDRGVALGPGLRSLIDDATHWHSRHLDTVSVELDLGDRLDSLGVGSNPDAAGRPAPLPDGQSLLEHLDGPVDLCLEMLANRDILTN